MSLAQAFFGKINLARQGPVRPAFPAGLASGGPCASQCSAQSPHRRRQVQGDVCRRHAPKSADRESASPKKNKKKKRSKLGVPAVFYCMITNIDENFGIMEEKLAALGLTENCIVIFSAGNGSTGGTRVFNVGMSGGKGGKLEGGHRVPFIMRRAKGRLAGGKDILDLCGVPAPPNYPIDGKSLRPLFEGKAFPERVYTLVK